MFFARFQPYDLCSRTAPATKNDHKVDHEKMHLARFFSIAAIIGDDGDSLRNDDVLVHPTEINREKPVNQPNNTQQQKPPTPKSKTNKAPTQTLVIPMKAKQ